MHALRTEWMAPRPKRSCERELTPRETRLMYPFDRVDAVSPKDVGTRVQLKDDENEDEDEDEDERLGT